MITSIGKQRVREGLEEWASESEQRRLWMSDGANGADVSSFIEARERLYTDTGLGHDLDSGLTVFGATADRMLQKLDMLISKIDANRPPDQIITDIRMREVRHLAAEILGMLPPPLA